MTAYTGSFAAIFRQVEAQTLQDDRQAQFIEATAYALRTWIQAQEAKVQGNAE